jgi:hypothetical protein
MCNGCRREMSDIRCGQTHTSEFHRTCCKQDMVVEVLAVVMRFEDGQAQTATADWTLHLRGNRAKRLLSKHNTPLPADLHPARSKSAFDWDLKSPAVETWSFRLTISARI